MAYARSPLTCPPSSPHRDTRVLSLMLPELTLKDHIHDEPSPVQPRRKPSSGLRNSLLFGASCRSRGPFHEAPLRGLSGPPSLSMGPSKRGPHLGGGCVCVRVHMSIGFVSWVGSINASSSQCPSITCSGASGSDLFNCPNPLPLVRVAPWPVGTRGRDSLALFHL